MMRPNNVLQGKSERDVLFQKGEGQDAVAFGRGANTNLGKKFDRKKPEIFK